MDDRFWRKVNKTSTCWLWLGTTWDGYGKFRRNGHTQFVHRAVYETMVGPIPSGLQIDHLCRVRNCVNPSHLEVVTQLTNIRRGTNSNRSKTHCPKGHPYSKENTYIPRTRPNNRMCFSCKRKREREWVANKRQEVRNA